MFYNTIVQPFVLAKMSATATSAVHQMVTMVGVVTMLNITLCLNPILSDDEQVLIIKWFENLRTHCATVKYFRTGGKTFDGQEEKKQQDMKKKEKKMSKGRIGVTEPVYFCYENDGGKPWIFYDTFVAWFDTELFQDYDIHKPLEILKFLQIENPKNKVNAIMVEKGLDISIFQEGYDVLENIKREYANFQRKCTVKIYLQDYVVSATLKEIAIFPAVIRRIIAEYLRSVIFPINYEF